MAFINATSWSNSSKIVILQAASYLTDPFCKVREYVYSFYTLNETCKTTAEKVISAISLMLGIIGFCLLAPFTAPLGAALRGIVSSLESKPCIYIEKAKSGKELPQDRKITLLSYNQCCTPAGYSITDGQVTPPSDKGRMNANIQKIKELNPDILCLYEITDINDALYLSSRLPEYPFIIPVSGVRAMCPSSMLFVASKYEIDEHSIEFVPYVKNREITGRARFSEKGFLSFGVQSRGEQKPFATIISTHLQHSEIPANPIDSDRISRAQQMHKIANHIQNKVTLETNVIVTGDLNQPEEEMDAFLEQYHVDWLRRDPSVQGKPTWGGDKWCSKLMGKPESQPLVLDYTFVTGKAAAISTKIIDTGYSSSEFKLIALSDHNPLFSVITVSHPLGI